VVSELRFLSLPTEATEMLLSGRTFARKKGIRVLQCAELSNSATRALGKIKPRVLERGLLEASLTFGGESMRKLYGIVFSAVLLIGNARPTWAQNLGQYPFGTSVALYDVNAAGVAMGWGDVNGDTQMVGVSLFGPHSGQWFKSGISSNGVAGEGGAIAGTGMIVGTIADSSGNARAYAWTADHQVGIDLGTLSGDIGSSAFAISPGGTMIVGLSYGDSGSTPVVWTLDADQRNGRQVTTWTIQTLPTGGLEQTGQVWPGVTLIYWGCYGVNDRGQIVGDAWSENYDEIAIIWNPLPSGRKWRIDRLPHQSSSGGHKYTEALSINNEGDIAGDMNLGEGWCDSNGVCTDLPALWRMESPQANAWKLVELTTLSGAPVGWNTAWGINNVGDVVGVSVDAGGNSLATRWVITTPGKPMVLGFPGDWSQAYQVNDFRIAVGFYGFDNGPNQPAAVAIH